jgi:hypothetical protein
MKDKILVTYSTRTGSTKGVSECIGKTLSDLGESIEKPNYPSRRLVNLINIYLMMLLQVEGLFPTHFFGQKNPSISDHYKTV